MTLKETVDPVMMSQDEFKYYDKMQETLNKNIQDNVFPHWRQHPSLKGNFCLFNCVGWHSMNYPTTLTSPSINRTK